MAYRRFRHVGEDKVTMDFAFFAIFNIKKMCAKLIKEGKGLITVAKYMFMGLFITRYNWNIATCCQMHEEKSSIAKRKYSRTVKYKRGCANVLTQPLLFLVIFYSVYFRMNFILDCFKILFTIQFSVYH